MGLTKTELYTARQNRLAALAKSLAHPARIAILDELMRRNACVNTDLVAEIGLAQATISQHLSELKAAGLIRGTIDGTRMNYCIDPDAWADLEATLGTWLASGRPGGSAPCC